jgi:hypothetical protein
MGEARKETRRVLLHGIGLMAFDRLAGVKWQTQIAAFLQNHDLSQNEHRIRKMIIEKPRVSGIGMKQCKANPCVRGAEGGICQVPAARFAGRKWAGTAGSPCWNC